MSLTARDACWTLAVCVWIVRWFLAQREIARIQQNADAWCRRACIFYHLIETRIPDIQEQADRVLAEKMNQPN